MQDINSSRRTQALSKTQIVATAITILNTEGESALTFRALADKLETGAGAIYHYISNKDELLSEAINLIIAKALGNVPHDCTADEAIRATALSLFDAFDEHPWIGLELANENRRYGLGFARICEAIGTKVDALGVPSDAQFNVASALGSYIIGAASQQANNTRYGRFLALNGLDRETYLTQMADRWRERLDPTEYPFMYSFLDKVPTHDDREQFIAGVDLILAGIRGRY